MATGGRRFRESAGHCRGGQSRLDRGILWNMATTQIQTLDRLLDPLRECLTPEVAAGIAGLQADTATQARLDELAEKTAEGTITPDERSEYEALVSAGNLIAVLQAKARAALADSE